MRKVSGRKQFLIFWLPVLLWMGFIFRCSAISGSDIPSLFPYEDIVFHAGVYAFLGWLFSRALFNTRVDLAPSLILGWVILFSLLYGISDELHQYFVPNRTADFVDVCIDMAGGTVGSIAYLWLRLNLLKR